MVGDVSQGRWPEGSLQKLALHGIVGLIEAKIGGGSVTAGVLGGMGQEILAGELSEYLVGQGFDRRSNDYKELLQAGMTLAGAAVGALVDGTKGAATAATAAGEGVRNNFLGHRDQARLDALREKNPEEMSAQEKSELRTLEEYDQQSDYLLTQLRQDAPLSNSDQALLTGLLTRYAQQDGVDAARELLASGAPYVGNYSYPFALGPYQAEYDAKAKESGLDRSTFRSLDAKETIASWLINPLAPRPEEERNY